MTTLADATEPRDAGYVAQLDREEAQQEAQEKFIRQFANTLAKPWPFLNRIPEDRCDAMFDEALPAIDDDEKKATAFNQKRLSVGVDPHTPLARQKISAMIEEQLNSIAEKAFEKNPRWFSGSSTGASVAANNASAPRQPPTVT